MGTQTRILSSGQEQPLRLFTNANPDGLVDAVVPVQWCITRDVMNRLSFRKVSDAHLLLVTTVGLREIDRQVVPLADGMTYLRFHKSGKNTVHATIVWSYDSSRNVKKSLLKRDGGAYVYDVIDVYNPEMRRLESARMQLLGERSHVDDDNSDEYHSLSNQIQEISAKIEEHRNDPPVANLDDFRHYTNVGRLDISAQLNVVVPKEMFAKKQMPQTTWLAGIYPWDSKPKDPCHVRKRASITFMTLPIAFVLYSVYWIGLCLAGMLLGLFNTVASAILLLFGKRGLSMDYILDPVEGIEEIFEARKTCSVWRWKKIKKGGSDFHHWNFEPRSIVFMFLNPVVFVGLTIIAFVISRFFGNFFEIVVGFFIGALMSTVLLFLFSRFYTNERMADKTKTREANAEIARQAEVSKYESLVGCSVASSDHVGLDTLPPQAQTMTLRFEALKARVCKPFERK